MGSPKILTTPPVYGGSKYMGNPFVVDAIDGEMTMGATPRRVNFGEPIEDEDKMMARFYKEEKNEYARRALICLAAARKIDDESRMELIAEAQVWATLATS